MLQCSTVEAYNWQHNDCVSTRACAEIGFVRRDNDTFKPDFVWLLNVYVEMSAKQL